MRECKVHRNLSLTMKGQGTEFRTTYMFKNFRNLYFQQLKPVHLKKEFQFICG